MKTLKLNACRYSDIPLTDRLQLLTISVMINFAVYPVGRTSAKVGAIKEREVSRFAEKIAL